MPRLTLLAHMILHQVPHDCEPIFPVLPISHCKIVYSALYFLNFPTQTTTEWLSIWRAFKSRAPYQHPAPERLSFRWHYLCLDLRRRVDRPDLKQGRLASERLQWMKLNFQSCSEKGFARHYETQIQIDHIRFSMTKNNSIGGSF